MHASPHLEGLPDELLLKIVTKLSLASQMNAAAASPRMKNVLAPLMNWQELLIGLGMMNAEALSVIDAPTVNTCFVLGQPTNDEDNNALVRKLSEMQNCLRLDYQMSSGYREVTFLSGMRNLTRLYLMGEFDAQLFIDCVAGNRNLVHVELMNGTFSGRNVASLALALPELQELDLFGCPQMSPETIRIVLKCSRRMTYINFTPIDRTANSTWEWKRIMYQEYPSPKMHYGLSCWFACVDPDSCVFE